MEQHEFQTLMDGLDSAFKLLTTQAASAKDRTSSALQAVSDTIKAAREAAEVIQQQQEKDEVKARLAAATVTMRGHLRAIQTQQQELDKHQATLAAITANEHDTDTARVERIRDYLADMTTTLAACAAAVTATANEGQPLLTKVQSLLTTPADTRVLTEYTNSCDSSKAACRAALDSHEAVSNVCSQVVVAVVARAAAAAEFECPMDGGKHSIEDMFAVSGCEHCCCRECAEGWAKAKLEEGLLPMCVVEGCKQPWTQVDMQLLDEELLRRYCAVEIHEYVRANNMYKCATPECGTPVERPREGLDTHFDCPMCKKESCLACQVPWHEGSSCEEYQRWKKENEAFGDQEFRRWLRDNQGRVHKTSSGGCGHAMLKTDCNSVWCAVCKYYFCWFCLKRIAEAGADSAQRHAHFAEPGPCYGKCWETPEWDDDDN